MPAMSFPLGSLQGDGTAAVETPPSGSTPSWRRQLLLLAGALAWVLFERRRSGAEDRAKVGEVLLQ